MFEKILQKLKAQRGETSNVSDRSLEDLARSLEPVITTDEILEKMDLSASIKSLDGNINHYTAEAVKTAKKKEDEEAAKKKKEEEDRAKQKSQQTNQEDIPDWAKKLMEQNEQVTNTLASLQTEKATSTRREKLKKSFTDKDGKELPEFYTIPILQAFERTKFENEEEFSEYMQSINSNNEAFRQQVKEQKINFGIPRKDAEIEEPTGETPALGEARKILAEQKKEKND